MDGIPALYLGHYAGQMGEHYVSLLPADVHCIDRINNSLKLGSKEDKTVQSLSQISSYDTVTTDVKSTDEVEPLSMPTMKKNIFSQN